MSFMALYPSMFSCFYCFVLLGLFCLVFLFGSVTDNLKFREAKFVLWGTKPSDGKVSSLLDFFTASSISQLGMCNMLFLLLLLTLNCSMRLDEGTLT